MSPHALRKTQLALAIMAIFASTSQAENTSPSSPTLLNQVTVSATRTEQTLDSVASSVVVTSADDIEKNMARDIRDMVRNEPGVDVTSDGRSGSGSFNIRGMDANRVKITVDGVSQAKAFDSTKMFLRSQRNYVDIDSMKAVEVVKGPASTLHGSDAIGGVVAFVTKDPVDFLKPDGDDSYASVKAGFASSDKSFSETLTFANRTGDLESLLIYTRRDGNELKTYGGRGGTGDTREQADPMKNASNNLLGKLQYQINDDHRVGITGEWQDKASKGSMLSMVGRQPTGNPSKYTRFDTNDSVTRKRIGVFHEWEADIAAFDSLKWSLNWQESQTNQITIDEMEVNTGILDWHNQRREKDYVYTDTSWQFDVDMVKALDFDQSSHLISYGLNVENNDQNNLNTTRYLLNPANSPTEITRYAPVASRQQVGLYLQDEILLMDERLTITPGLRYDHFKNTTESDKYHPKEYKDTSYGNWSARLGAVYEINDKVSVFGQYSQGFGLPDLYAMYFEKQMPGVVWIKSNPDLKPEESQSVEFGLRTKGEAGSMEVTAYYNQYKNFIERVQIGGISDGYIGGIHQHQNLKDATIKGVEFRSQLWLDSFGLPEGTVLNSSLAWSHGRGTKQGKSTQEPLNSIAPLKAVFALGYNDPSGTWGSEAAWTLVAGKSRKDISEDDANEDDTTPDGKQFATPGYGIVDLTTYYKPHRDVTIRAGLFNLTDKKYWIWDDVRGKTDTYAGISRFTQPGRNYSISVKWEI